MSWLISHFKQQDAKFIFLTLTLIVLPTLEAPKNLFLVLFIASWAFISKRERSWGGKWRLIDTIFLLWILADIVIGVNAVMVHDQPANGSKDIIKFVLLGWVVSRSEFSTIQMTSLSVIAIIFAVIPLGYSYLNCNGGTCIELNSVGHVNHTAIYLSIVYTLSLSLLVFSFKNISNYLRVALIITTGILAYVVIDTNSRAASGLISIITLMAMLYSIYHYRNWSSLITSILLISLASTILIYNPPSVVNKFIHGSSLTGDSSRHKIRNFAYEIFKIDPILGTGMSNFPNFDLDDIKANVIREKGSDWWNSNASSTYLPHAHPHNIYYVYLTGGGLILFSIFSWFWLKMIQIIYRVNKRSNEKWLVFGGTGVVMIVLGAGWLNTTLAHEHALITMLALGFVISIERKFCIEK